MSARGNVIKKALEAFTDARRLYGEIYKKYEFYQYQRNNVKGVSFDREPTGKGTGETKALLYDKEMSVVTAELYRLQLFLDWVNDILDPLEPEDESLIRERFILGWTAAKVAEAHSMSVEQVRYRIDRIIEEM